MRKFQNAPWWVLSLVTGVSFGAFMTVFAVVRDSGSWQASVIGGAAGGVLFGAVMGPVLARQRNEAVAAAGPLPLADLRAATRAASRGPVPADPEVRHAAVKLAIVRSRQLERFRWLGVVVFVLFALLGAALAVTSTPWWWVTAAFFALSAGACIVLPARASRRVELLRRAG